MARRGLSTFLKCLGCLGVGVMIAASPTLYFRVVYPGQDDGNTAISWFVETAFFAAIGFLVAYFGVFVVLFRSIKRGK
jgi:hypothetical protein